MPSVYVLTHTHTLEKVSRKQNGHTPSLPAGDAGAPGAACGTEPRFLRGPSLWAAVFNFPNEKQHRRDHGDASASELRFRRSREMPCMAHTPLIRAIELFTEHVLRFMSHRKKKETEEASLLRAPVPAFGLLSRAIG